MKLIKLFWNFLSNIWKFRKELYNHEWWSYSFTLQMLYRSISIMEKGMHGGNEVSETRNKKIQKMQRLLVLLDNNINDKYIEIAEKELGCELILNDFEFKELDEDDFSDQKLYEIVDNDTIEEKEINRKITERARNIEELEWIEICEIIKGQDLSELSKKSYDGVERDWFDLFDGTGLRGWWD